jgi:hypothetical protein
MGIKISALNEHENLKGEDVIPIVDIKNLGTKKVTLANILKLIFPIGSTYVTQLETNPKEILGFGTWERLKGKVCLGVDEEDVDLNEIGKTGGEKEHTLTIAEMPSHNHSTSLELYALKPQGGSQEFGSGGALSKMIAINNTGGGQAHNNMQPFEVVGYMWIRRS